MRSLLNRDGPTPRTPASRTARGYHLLFRLPGFKATNRAGVLPGVDLVLTATIAGVDEVLVVKSREAASNAALGSLHFTTSTRGLKRASNRTGASSLSISNQRSQSCPPQGIRLRLN